MRDVEPAAAADIIRRAVEESIEVKAAPLASELPVVVRFTEILVHAFRAGHKLLLFGNGGGAADAQHVAAEFMSYFQAPRPPLPAIALTTDSSILTSVANDVRFEHVFARQLEALVTPGDVAVAITTSGRSANVLEGLRMARTKGALTVGMTGRNGDDLKRCVDLCVCVPSARTVHPGGAHCPVACGVRRGGVGVVFVAARAPRAARS